MDEHRKVPKRIAQTVLNSLKGGVVPRIGLPYITVGRKGEIEALLHDVDIISEGGASFRFIAGRYGSGKSFLLQTIRNYVMDRGLIVADADLSPERRLQGTKGQGLATYGELISNLSTKTKSEGGALTAEEMLVLCEKLAEMHAGLYNYSRHITTKDLVGFIRIEYGRIGADQNITPGEVIRDFIELLDLLYQYPEMDLESLLSSEKFSYAKSEAVSDETDSGFVEFTL